MRTPHIAAIIAAATPDGLLYADEVRTLIGEVERLEAELAKMTAWHDSALSVASEMSQRAETAEARVAELEAQNARLREVLGQLQSDAQCTLDLYYKNGPTWTSRDSGAEYYSASFVIDGAEERIATSKAALAGTEEAK